jgi:hypothetical protein
MQKLQYRFVDEESNIIQVSGSFQNNMLNYTKCHIEGSKLKRNYTRNQLSLTWGAKEQDLLHDGATRTNESCEGSH